MGPKDAEPVEFVSTSRSRRATAGKRMNKLIGEAIDEDNSFWGHDVWNQEDKDDFSSDDCSSDGALDSADSDFDDPQEPDSDGEDEEKAVRKEERASSRRAARSSGAYVDPAKRRPRRKKPTASSSSTSTPSTVLGSDMQDLVDQALADNMAVGGDGHDSQGGPKKRQRQMPSPKPAEAQAKGGEDAKPIEFVSTSRSRRATAGKRMNKLIGEAIDEDNSFWGHDVWNQEDKDDFSSDDCSSDGALDSADSDFDKPQSSSDEEEKMAAEKDARKEERMASRRQKASTAAYVDPKQRRGRGRSGSKSAVSAVEMPGSSKADLAQSERRSRRSGSAPTAKKKQAPKPEVMRKSVRSSTMESTQATKKATLQEEKERAQLQKKQQKKKKAAKEERRLTQEDLLAEAALTEQYNIAYLAELRRHEEEEKSKEIKVREARTEPYYTYHSKEGKNTITFHNMSDVPDCIKAKPIPRPQPAYCAITGQPALYRDPFTNKPFATADAFAAIRRRARR